MDEVFVHPCVAQRHPELTAEDVRAAWRNCMFSQRRMGEREGQVLAVGVDERGREVEMVAVEDCGGWLIYHAMTPATKKTLKELGLKRRRSWIGKNSTRDSG